MSIYAFCAVLTASAICIALSAWAELDLIKRDFAANESGNKLPQRVRRQSDRLVYRTHSDPAEETR